MLKYSVVSSFSVVWSLGVSSVAGRYVLHTGQTISSSDTCNLHLLQYSLIFFYTCIVVRLEKDEDIIPGSYGQAIISFFAFDQRGNKGVICCLESIQCLGGGKRFVGGMAAAAAKMAEEEFEEGEVLDTEENDEEDLGDA